MNAAIRDIAMHVAEQGYRVLVPDLYRGRVAVDRMEAVGVRGTAVCLGGGWPGGRGWGAWYPLMVADLELTWREQPLPRAVPRL